MTLDPEQLTWLLGPFGLLVFLMLSLKMATGYIRDLIEKGQEAYQSRVNALEEGLKKCEEKHERTESKYADLREDYGAVKGGMEVLERQHDALLDRLIKKGIADGN